MLPPSLTLKEVAAGLFGTLVDAKRHGIAPQKITTLTLISIITAGKKNAMGDACSTHAG
jgi:hypothetical protein